MAFFGLTSLGNQNPFNSCQEVPIHIFTEQDFKKAWDDVAKEQDFVQVADVKQILRKVYMCPDNVDPPEQVMTDYQCAFEQYNSVTKDHYFKTIRELCERSSNNESYHNKACEFSSGEEYRMSLGKQARMQRGPREKYNEPLTTSQELGWNANADNRHYFPKKSCDETKYASAMVKAGMFF